LDLGIYGVDWIRFITNQDPRLQHACLSENANGLDVFAHATYAAGDALATMTCGYIADANDYYLSGEKGSIYAPVSLSGRALPSVLHVHLIGSDRRYSEEFPAENAYVLELDYFAQCILANRAPFLDAENARQNLAMIQEIRTSASRTSAGDVP
jgi:predicted dehydrogenase